MREYICTVCGAEWHSAGTDKPCERCGGKLIEVGAFDTYKRGVAELIRQGLSLEEAIEEVNRMIGG